jgi:fructose-1,6-bisphosphatase I
VVTTLPEHLAAWSAGRDDRAAVAATLAAIAAAAAALSAVIAQGPLAGDFGRVQGPSRDGDGQKALDLHANDLFVAHLRAAPVAVVASEEVAEVVVLQAGAPLAVAIDPLDGSNNIGVNAPMGTLFSLLPVARAGLPAMAFLAPGSRQLAAGFVLYGPHTAMVLTLGEGVHIFTLDRHEGVFVLTQEAVRIPPGRREYAINASNGRHWPLAIRAFVEECVAGAEGPRGVDYNMRWLGAVVAEAYRIFVNGGIYLYPGDARPGYRRGRLRLLYEANPIALLMEQAGGTATDGYGRILDLVPSDIHEHVPLIFGSPDKVERVMELYAASVPQAGQRPLFAARGLFKS